MAIDENHYKGWRIEILHGDQGWKTLVYRPSSPLHEVEVPQGPDREAVFKDAQILIDKVQG